VAQSLPFTERSPAHYREGIQKTYLRTLCVWRKRKDAFEQAERVRASENAARLAIAQAAVAIADAQGVIQAIVNGEESWHRSAPNPWTWTTTVRSAPRPGSPTWRPCVGATV
jgi:hypothetical protein